MANVSYDKESHTLTNHELNKTYTFGQRGKRAAWVQEWVEANGLPDYKPEEEAVVEPEDHHVEYDDDSKTFTNHTLDKTYTYGQRGKKAAWVIAHEEAEGITPPPKATANVRPVDAEDVEHHITFDEDEGVLTNHTLDKTYTFGQRGKKPAWVRAWIVDHEDETESVNSHKNEQVPVNQPNQPKYICGPNGLREWHFKSEMNNQCILIGHDPAEAMMIYNSQTKFPLTTRSLEIFWQETDYMSGFDVGCWRFDPDTEMWENYGDYKNRLETARLARVDSMIEEAETHDVAAADAGIDYEEREIVEDEMEEEAIAGALDAFAEDDAMENMD